MSTAALVAAALVAVLHAGFMVLELFLWDRPAGRRIFGLTREFAAASKALAANQGLYNGFLAAGLAWGITLADAGSALRIFFLGCVIVAGIFGAATVDRRIFWVQAAPALLALGLALAA